jgi:hypothetical protein
MLWLYCEEGAMHAAINGLVSVSPMESKTVDVRCWIYGTAWPMATRVKGRVASWKWEEANMGRFL